ncbi:hypothetical protein NLU13_3823 [Sarocladium strictum]|uniref:Uncharacterized protein n=1 Tax=Sarocladium strictum TaxID=5046 RepID=A0AA39GHR6_SARSR|nr:hypothetical protein NLU13_3823 [Sarocladium strictum]
MADASSMNYIYTIGGYAALAAVGYVFYHVKTTENKKRTTTPDTKAARSSQPEPRKDDRKKKQRLQSFTSESAKVQQAPVAAPAEPETYASKAKSKPEKADNDLDFAQQLVKAQEGKKFLNKTEGGKQREKTVKQSRVGKAKEPVATEAQSPPSSTTGGDADEETSPIQSPEIAPADPSGVADMLEPAPKGPSVLRLTEPTNKPAPKPKAAKAPEVVETKKQRQNRKKAEAAKEARQEAEKERKVLEERQRRTARIAEGRAAKDGSQSTNANIKKSAWSEGAPASEGSKAADTNGFHQPLDTFEKPAGAKPTEQTKVDANWIAVLPSEEEQMEKLKDDADEWSTVQSKSVKAKKNKQVSSASSGDDQAQPPAKQEVEKPAPQPQRPAPAPKTTSGASKNFGSFSALSKDEPADEVEEEWDV